MVKHDIRQFLIDRFKEMPKLERLDGGANNQVYKVTCQNSKFYILKKYFFHSLDQRDRLFHEYSFLQYAKRISLTNVPKPIDFCLGKRIGLYSVLPGRKAIQSDVVEESIDQFISFFQGINEHKHLALQLPMAIDRTICLNDHFHLIERRLRALSAIEIFEEIDREMLLFIGKEIAPFYVEFKNCIFKLYKEYKVNVLSKEELCISPSDFGFHNVLISGSKLYFYDFEYAGFDDPVNLLANYFCQPKNPIPEKYLSSVSKVFLSFLPYPERGLERFSIIYPLCQIKWCLLVLNIFQNIGAKRRTFSSALEKKSEQLKYSKQLFSIISGCPNFI